MDLRAEVDDESWARTLEQEGWRKVTLSERQEALCAYAEKLTLTPAAMSEEDIDSLRSASLSDEDVLDAIQATSYFNYINRVADAIGVPPEPEWDN